MNSNKGITLVVCFILLASLGNMVTFVEKGATIKTAEVAAHGSPLPLTGYVYWDQNMNQIFDPGEPFAYYDADFDGTFDGDPDAGGAGRGEGAYIFFDNKGVDLDGSPVLGTPQTGSPNVPFGNGSYSISAPIGNHWITVRLPGWQVQTKNVSIGPDLHPAYPLNFGIIPFDSISGRVVKTDGTGIVGMHIYAYPFGGRPDFSDPLSPCNRAADVPPDPSCTNTYPNTDGWWAEAKTDLFGNYILKGLPPGQYDLLMYKREYFAQWKYNIVVDARNYTVDADFDGDVDDVVAFNWHTTENVNFINVSYDYGTISGFVFGGGSPLQGAVVEIPGLGISTSTAVD